MPIILNEKHRQQVEESVRALQAVLDGEEGGITRQRFILATIGDDGDLKTVCNVRDQVDWLKAAIDQIADAPEPDAQPIVGTG